MEAEQVVVPAQVELVAPDAGLQGVRGWLLFFCVTLVFLNPLATLGFFGYSLSQIVPAFDRLPGLLVVAIADGVASLALMSLSVYAGISLWRVRPNAVKSAKTFLLAGVAYVLISPLLILLSGLPIGVAASTLPDAYLSAGRSLVYYAIWFNYLRTSKRVQATYLPPDPA